MAYSNNTSYWDQLGIKGEILLVALILLGGALLRLFAFTDFTNGTLKFAGTCGQLFDEAKPLFDARNPLHFEIFFYPPVAPIIVASTAMLLQSFLPEALDFARYCLLFNIGVSVATLLVIYMVGRQWSVQVGLATMSFYAVTMIAVYSSNNIQMYPTFFSMLAFYFFYRTIQKQTVFNLVLMGVLLGLAVTSKYFPIMLGLMVFMVYFELQLRSSHKAAIDDTVQLFGGKNFNQRTAFAWTSMLWGILIATIAMCYVSLFYKDMILAVFQSLYNRYPHDHPFAYHLATVNRLYQAGVFGMGGIATAIALGLYIPYRKGFTPWAWFQRFSQCQRFWLIPLVSMLVTIVITLGIPAIFNLNNYLKYTTWIAKTYASSDGGFFPAGHPAPSYFLSYFPENLGIPLFVLGCTGIAHCLYVKEKKAMLLLLIALPLYIALELSSVKVNRFAMDLMPLFCLFAAIALVQLLKVSYAFIRTLAVLVFVFVVLYSSLYSLAWANLQRSLHTIPVETVSWINMHVNHDSALGMKADLWLAGSPGLLPDPASLVGFEIAHYTEYPDFIVLPKTLYEIMKQYGDLTQAGYTYGPSDWSPFPPPIAAEVAVLMDLVYEQQYRLVTEFELKPAIFGITFGSQSIRGRTWLLEHTGSYGMRLYKKRQVHNNANLGLQ